MYCLKCEGMRVACQTVQQCESNCTTNVNYVGAMKLHYNTKKTEAIIFPTQLQAVITHANRFVNQ